MINLDDPEAVKDSGKPSAQKKRMTCDVNEGAPKKGTLEGASGEGVPPGTFEGLPA